MQNQINLVAVFVLENDAVIKVIALVAMCQLCSTNFLMNNEIFKNSC